MVREYPLVTCLCPTMPERAAFLERSIVMFNAQTYPNKELVIVEESYTQRCREAMAYAYKRQDNIVHIRLEMREDDPRLTIGTKRNLASTFAWNSAVYVHWDDDDIFGPNRLMKQVLPLLEDTADTTAFMMSLLYDVSTNTLYCCSDEVHAALFAHNVRSGTLAYKASFSQSLGYPNWNTGEDVAMLQSLMDKGARLQQIIDPASYICVRHGGNVTHPLEYGQGWEQMSAHDYLSEGDIAFYQGLRKANV